MGGRELKQYCTPAAGRRAYAASELGELAVIQALRKIDPAAGVEAGVK